MEIIRELNQAEVFFHLCHEWCNAYLTPFVRLKVKGVVDEIPFQQALNQTIKKHPLLNASIQFGDGKHLFCTGNDAALSRALFVHRKHEDQWTSVAYKAIKKKFDTRKGPLFKLLVLKSAVEEVHDIIFVAHHAIIDQKTFFIFINDLFAAYDGVDIQQLVSMPLVANKKKLRKKHYFAPSKSQNVYPNLKKATFSSIFLMLQKNVLAILTSSKNPKIRTRTFAILFDERQTKNILYACKKNNINLFGFVAAVFATCIGEYNQRSFNSAVTLNLDKNAHHLGCQVSIFDKLKWYPQTKLDIWSLAKFYYKYIKNLLRQVDPQVFIPRIPSTKLWQKYYFYFLKTKMRWSGYLQKKAVGAAMINVAFKPYTLDYKRLVVECVNCSGNPFFTKREQFYIGALVVNDKLNVTFSCTMVDDDADELKNKIIGLIQEFGVAAEQI